MLPSPDRVHLAVARLLGGPLFDVGLGNCESCDPLQGRLTSVIVSSAVASAANSAP